MYWTWITKCLSTNIHHLLWILILWYKYNKFFIFGTLLFIIIIINSHIIVIIIIIYSHINLLFRARFAHSVIVVKYYDSFLPLLLVKWLITTVIVNMTALLLLRIVSSNYFAGNYNRISFTNS